jgi:hypothetical protein
LPAVWTLVKGKAGIIAWVSGLAGEKRVDVEMGQAFIQLVAQRSSAGGNDPLEPGDAATPGTDFLDDKESGIPRRKL